MTTPAACVVCGRTTLPAGAPQCWRTDCWILGYKRSETQIKALADALEAMLRASDKRGREAAAEDARAALTLAGRRPTP